MEPQLGPFVCTPITPRTKSLFGYVSRLHYYHSGLFHLNMRYRGKALLNRCYEWLYVSFTHTSKEHTLALNSFYEWFPHFKSAFPRYLICLNATALSYYFVLLFNFGILQTRQLRFDLTKTHVKGNIANLNQITFLGCPVNSNKTIMGQSLT